MADLVVVAHMADPLAVMAPPAPTVMASALLVFTVIVAAAITVPIGLRDTGASQRQGDGGRGDSDQLVHGPRLCWVLQILGFQT